MPRHPVPPAARRFTELDNNTQVRRVWKEIGGLAVRGSRLSALSSQPPRTANQRLTTLEWLLLCCSRDPDREDVSVAARLKTLCVLRRCAMQSPVPFGRIMLDPRVRDVASTNAIHSPSGDQAGVVLSPPLKRVQDVLWAVSSHSETAIFERRRSWLPSCAAPRETWSATSAAYQLRRPGHGDSGFSRGLTDPAREHGVLLSRRLAGESTLSSAPHQLTSRPFRRRTCRTTPSCAPSRRVRLSACSDRGRSLCR